MGGERIAVFDRLAQIAPSFFSSSYFLLTYQQMLTLGDLKFHNNKSHGFFYLFEIFRAGDIIYELQTNFPQLVEMKEPAESTGVYFSLVVCELRK